MKQFDYLSQLQAIRELRSEVRNWQEMRTNESWRWSCAVCGDSKRDLRKARFGVTRKGASFVCNCFNCGYANNFVMYLRAFHPDQYRTIVSETLQSEDNRFDLNDIVNKASDNVLSHLFLMRTTNQPKQWLQTLIDKKITVNKSNIKKLLNIFNKVHATH